MDQFCTFTETNRRPQTLQAESIPGDKMNRYEQSNRGLEKFMMSLTNPFVIIGID